ncbi:regulatory protein RecX [Lichenibacterium dinghuense]|uniref:regulatory protein RecX n=1 Tax=Lichenibacterium dinghuense TaxID=2895977 RepID=UPI001F0262ED|nr:RecX family transcriptional regulator [Lichenibacterium sp. 6Y81]
MSPESLMRMASFYLARYSASTARLREVLERKVRRRCELREAPVPEGAEMRALIDGVVERLTRAGLIDDAAFGRGRAAALARKGLPAWRIKAELGRQNVDLAEESVAEAVDLDEEAQARRLAQRKRLGPWRPGEREPYRDKDLRVMVRAGFPLGLAKRVVDGEAD